MTGTGKDVAVTVYLAGAIGAYQLTDINQVLAGIGLALGIVLAMVRIAHACRHWNTPPKK